MGDAIATIDGLSGSDEAMSASSNDQNHYCNTINTNHYNTMNLMQFFIIEATLYLLSCLFYVLVCLSLDYIDLVELFVISH